MVCDSLVVRKSVAYFVVRLAFVNLSGPMMLLNVVIGRECAAGLTLVTL